MTEFVTALLQSRDSDTADRDGTLQRDVPASEGLHTLTSVYKVLQKKAALAVRVFNTVKEKLQ